MNLTSPVIQSAGPKPAPRTARVDLVEEFGWRKLAAGSATIWFAGQLYGDGLGQVKRAAATGDLAGLTRLLRGLDGHFALIVESGDTVLAATDPIASIPLFFAQTGTGECRYAVDARARRLTKSCALEQLDDDAVLSVGMSGYSLGDTTLYRGLTNLYPGEYALFRNGICERARYFVYRPWQVRERSDEQLQRELGDLLRGVLEKLKADLAGRTILVPISAGIDSRLVAAGLKDVGHRDVRCFSYGQCGNHEADTGRRVSEHLGLPWTFIETTQDSQRKFFTGALAREFTAYADTLGGIPFYQDYDELRRLKESAFAPADAVIINGQSGDYLTGNHVPASLWPASPTGMGENPRWQRILAPAIAKHFSLWQHLKTPGNLARVTRLLRAEIENAGGSLGEPGLDFALYEQSEYDNRQSRYVVQGQRIYDHQGFDWRLPLWDRALIEFFESVPLSAKRQQKLYRDTVIKLDWGGVWRHDINRKWVTPAWLRPVRLAARLAIAPFGRQAWHDFERRHFAWHMNTSCLYAIVPPSMLRRDRRGFRNAFSWHGEAYLADKGIALDSLAERAA